MQTQTTFGNFLVTSPVVSLGFQRVDPCILVEGFLTPVYPSPYGGLTFADPVTWTIPLGQVEGEAPLIALHADNRVPACVKNAVERLHSQHRRERQTYAERRANGASGWGV